MAKIEPFEAYKAQQRRLALLALLADQPKATTDCVADEQLASLVEGALSQQESEQCMAHLAQCDRCSGLWVQLDQEWQRQERQEQRNKRRKLQKKPRPFTVVGSILAAAASVAVFVTITTRVDRKTAHLPPPPAARQQERLVAPPAPAEKGVEQESTLATASPQRQEMAAAVDTTTVPVTASVPLADSAVHDQQNDTLAKQQETAPPVATTAQEPLLASPAVAVAEKKEAASPLAAAAEPVARMTKPAATPPATAVGGAPPLSLATWQEQLRHDCTRPPTPEQLAALAALGRQLLASSSLDEARRQRINTLLEPLEAQQEVEARCKAILELLASSPVP